MTNAVRQTERSNMADETQKMAVQDDEARLQPVRLFSMFMSKLADGEADPDIMAELKDIIEVTKAHAKYHNKESRGRLTLKIMVNMEPDGTARFNYDADKKVPKFARKGSVAYVTAKGTLTFKNPKQTEFGFIREVDGTPVSPRTIAAESSE